MNLEDSLVFFDVHAADKADSFQQMVRLLREAGVVGDPQKLLSDLQRREAVENTGVGRGMAIPHARTPAVSELVVAMGRFPQAIDYGADDGQGVHLFFLIATPESHANEYLRVLSRLARRLREPEVRDLLLGARTPGEVREILSGSDRGE